MGKKYLDTKEGSLEQSVLGVWQTAIEEGGARRTKSEKLVGGQKKLDKYKDGDIDGKDFAMLRKSKNKDKKEEVQIDELIGAVPAAVGGYVAGKIMSGKKHKKVKKEDDQIDEDILPQLYMAGVASALLPVLFMSVREIIRGTPLESSIKKIIDKLKKNKNYKMSDSEKSDVKGFVSKVKKEKPSLLQKAMKKIKENDQIDEILPAVAGVAARGLARVAAPAVAGYALGKENVKKKQGIKSKVIKAKKEEVEESYEIGTDKYRKHTEDITPGEDGEWVEAVNAKNISMREALAKVWGVDEGKNPFKKEDKKGDKTLTGKKVASVDVNPTIKEKTK